ncbi:MAG TPA: ceramidase domain-containing protein [Planctomycetaceae bacterium]|nr:ceramidase domain-containing protein [Planctomycetaceae bacterium]
MAINHFEIPSPLEYVDLYCERTGPGLWNEPFNATSNLMFFLVAWLVWKRAKKSGTVSRSIPLLILLTIAIGVGSILFHTLATRWAMALDVVPILLLKLAFLWTYGRDVLHWKLRTVASIGIGLLIVSLIGLQYKHLLNGSLLYLPGALLLVGMGAVHLQRNFAEPWSLLVGSGWMLAAIVFRTSDHSLCAISMGHGTHFLWHLSSGCVIYYTLICLIANLPRSEKKPG